jgi:hypothetical protein
MRIFIRLLFIGSLTILLSSCSKIIYIGKRIDPEIVLEEEQRDIVFVNLFDYTSQTNILKKDEISFHNGVMGLLEGLSSFASDSTFRFVVADTLKKGVDPGFLTTLLPVDSVSSICNRFNSNMLLTLDSLNIYFDWETVSDDGDNGFKSKTKNFYINTRFFLSLYSATGNLINRSELDKSTFYRSRPTLSGIITIVPSLERAREDIGGLSYEGGLDYVSKFYPQITQETRQLFSGSQFAESNRYVFEREWAKAIELLNVLTGSSDQKIAEKARHNLDVVKEAVEASEK